MIKKLNWSIQELNTFFGIISEAVGGIFWIRSADYKKQIYVSPNFTSYWGRPVDQLYQNPESFIETIIDSHNTAKSVLTNRYNLLTQKEKDLENLHYEVMLFQVNHPDNKSVYVKDKAYLFKDANNELVAIAGFGYIISYNEWVHEKEGINIPNYYLKIEQGLIKLIEKILFITPVTKEEAKNIQLKALDKREKIQLSIDGNEISFTLREMQCLHYSTQGQSAKLIGEQLYISPRTVETYFEQIKLKLGCKTKLELLARFDADTLEVFKYHATQANQSKKHS